MANQSIQYEIISFLKELLTEESQLQALFPNEEVICGLATMDDIPNLCIQYDVDEFPAQVVGKGQFFYNLDIMIDVISPYEETAHRTAKIISTLHPSGYNSQRRIYTSPIDQKKYSIAPFFLESVRNYPRSIQKILSYTVSQKYSTDVYEVI